MPIFTESDLIQRLSKVEGFLRPAEAFLLHTLAGKLPNEAVAAEVGSWMGRSSVAIALPLVEKKGKLHTIDDHRGITGAEGYTPREYLLGQFEKNIRESGVASVVEHHPKSSDDLAGEWNTQVDFLFIDGDHRHQAVVNDIRHYTPFVKPGGWLAFHDSGNPEVSKAIKEWAARVKMAPAAVAFTGTILALKMPGEGDSHFPQSNRDLLWKCFNLASCVIPSASNPIKKLRVKLSQSMARKVMRKWTREALS
ncbi:MAG: class I SAM-dependent methyltransferase [Verrucomicrobiales bacterium]